MMNQRGKEHSIRQQFVYAETNGTEADGMALQRRLSDLCRDHLEMVIGRVLDHCTPTSGRMCLERLELDLGNIPLHQLEEVFLQKTATALEKAVREAIPAHLQDQVSSPEPGETAYWKDERATLWEVLSFFLKTGSLPWAFRLPDLYTLEQCILEQWEKQGATGGQQFSGQHSLQERTFSDISILLRNSPSARKRLIWQFSMRFRQELLRQMLPFSQEEIAELITGFSKAFDAGAEIQNFDRILWDIVFAQVPVNRQIRKTTFVTSIFQAIAKLAPGEKITFAQQTALKKVFATEWPEIVFSLPVEKNETKSAAVASTPENNVPPTGKFQDISDTVRQSQIPAEGIYVDNAGLILVHPFLATLFGSLGIAENHDLLQPGRALCLLHFLATAQAQAPEYELVLPKILCNVPINAPVDTLVELSSADMEAAVEMLQALIGHWTALRNTSPDGLRGAFLRRAGKLTRREDHLLLQVERQSIDVLLDRLPWGISVVKLPWMGDMIWVEWS